MPPSVKVTGETGENTNMQQHTFKNFAMTRGSVQWTELCCESCQVDGGT